MFYRKQNDSINNVCRNILYKASISMLIITSSLTTTTSMASVYKVTTSDGRVIFTDNPHNYYNNDQIRIEPIDINPTPVASIGSSTLGVANNSSNSPYNRSNSGIGQQPIIRTINNTDYQIQIVSPENEQVFRRPAQGVDINIEVSPSVQNGDTIAILLDDEPIGGDLSVSIPTLDITPGKHTLTVEVNTATGDKVSSDSIEFYVIQNTLTYQRNKQLAERLDAYNKLPWYTKLYLQLRQNELHQDDKPIDIHGQTSSSFSNGGSGSAF